MEMLESKQDFVLEGAVTDEVNAILALIMGVGVATLLIIFVSVLGGQVYSETAGDLTVMGGAVVNETLGTGANLTGILSATLAHPIVSSPIITCNGVATSNYTLTTSTGAIAVNGADCSLDTVLASYTYGDKSSYDYTVTAIQSGFQSLKITGTYLPIVVLAVIIFIVLGLVMGLTPRGSGQTGGAL